jgi:hypothetical protein
VIVQFTITVWIGEVAVAEEIGRFVSKRKTLRRSFGWNSQSMGADLQKEERTPKSAFMSECFPITGITS